MPMAHVLKAWLHLLGTEPAGRAVADESNRAAAALPADERERAHLATSQALAAGRLQEASMRRKLAVSFMPASLPVGRSGVQ